MNRREFLGGLAAAAASCAVPRFVWAAEGLPPLRLVFYTDVHAMPGLADESLLERAAFKIAAEVCDAIIAGGDVIHRGHVSAAGECLDRFRLYRRFLDRIGREVRHVPGNHDLAGACPEDGSPPEADPWRLWREELGIPAPCRMFDAADYRCVILDTLEIVPGSEMGYRGHAGPGRLSWLRETLADTPADTPLILCTHIPLISDFATARNPGGVPDSLVTADTRDILAAFEGLRLAAVLQGHLHIVEKMETGGVPLLTGGAVCGAWWKGANHGTPPGYARVRIADGTLAWEYVPLA